jgi:DtxR family Mn-dependent transcriptional regulator
MSRGRELSRSMQDHLEAIYWLSGKRGHTCCSEIASFMDHKPPSVTKMLGRLKDEGLIKHKKYDIVELTANGERVAQQLAEKHKTIERMLRIIGVDSANAEKDACEIEHVVSRNTMEKFERLADFLQESRCLAHYRNFPGRQEAE